MGYSEDDSMVRVDFFKSSGKWYTAEAVKWLDYKGDIHDIFKRSLDGHLEGRLSGMIAVCLHPCHEHSHPLMIHLK